VGLATMVKVIVCIGLVVFGALIIFFSKKIVEAGARLNPRFYRKELKVINRLAICVVGMYAVLLGLHYLINCI
jgi:uncharacterized protein YneF (UPF0154 family)